ncbi:MAG TPA: PAS domain-containing protein, partial [Tahibacter sp.]|nr:PAS domain-containing protein [Tahibacter sp.]
MANAFLPSFLTPFSRDEIRHIVWRVKARFRRAWNEAVIPLGLAMGLATLAAVSLRILLLRQEAVEREDRRLFTQTFGVEQEQRELPYPGVVAGLLGTINNRYEALHCQEGDALPACRRKDAVLDTVTRLFMIAVDTGIDLPAPTQGGCADELSVGVRASLLDLWAGGADDPAKRCAWLAAAADAMRAIRAETTEAFHACPPAQDGKSPSVYGIGEPACQQRGTMQEAATLLSAQLSRHHIKERLLQKPASADAQPGDAAAAPSPPGVSSGSARGAAPLDDWDSDAKEAAEVARLLDIGIMNAKSIPAPRALTPHGATAPANGNVEVPAFLDHAELRQAYFISPDNLLRIWALDGNPLMELPRARLWSSAAYLRPFVDKGARFAVKTRAYLDVGGNGVVTTECRPLWVGTGKASTFVGAVCTDLTLNILANERLREMLVSNRFLHIEPVVISVRDTVRAVEQTHRGKLKWSHDLKALQNAVFGELDKLGLPLLSQTVRQILVDDVSAFIVPIGKVDEYSIEALVVSPESPTINWKLLRWTVLLIVGAAGYLVFTFMMGFKKKSEERARSDQIIFRSSQTGIIVTLPDGERIVRANDRAEEILGVRLPKSGNPNDPSAKSFTEIYDLALEVVDDPWPDARDGGEEGLPGGSTPGPAKSAAVASTAGVAESAKSNVAEKTVDAQRAQETATAGTKGTGDAAKRDGDGESGDAKKAAPKKPVRYRVLSPADIFSRRFEGRTTRYWIHLKNVTGNPPENLARSWASIQAGPLVQQTHSYLTWLLRSWLTHAKFEMNKSVGSFGTVDR